jgi:thiol-disulfide isomerase/thioredoxin
MIKNFNLKKIIKEIAIFAILLFVISNVLSYINAPKLHSNTLPSFNAKTLDGENFRSSTLRQKPLLIHFWATWCPICKVENGTIDDLSSHFDVITIAVNSGDNDKVKKFLNTHHLHFKVINDQNGVIASLFAVKAFPTTFIYNKNNRLLFSDVGYSSFLGLYLRMLYSRWSTSV